MENPFLFPKQNGYKSDFHAISRQKNAGCQKRSQGGKKPGDEMGSLLLVALGPMCDAEKDWDERFFRASGEINGCQKSPLDEPEINFSFFISEQPVVYFQKPFWCFRPKSQYVYVCCNDA